MHPKIRRIGVQEFLIHHAMTRLLEAFRHFTSVGKGELTKVFSSLLSRILKLEGALNHAPRLILLAALIVRQQGLELVFSEAQGSIGVGGSVRSEQCGTPNQFEGKRAPDARLWTKPGMCQGLMTTVWDDPVAETNPGAETLTTVDPAAIGSMATPPAATDVGVLYSLATI